MTEDFDPEAEWTSRGLGWMLTFQTKPDGIDDLPVGSGPGTKGGLMVEHFKGCFEKLDEITEDGVLIVNRMEFIGCVAIVGEQAACERLKERVESEGFALMCKNTRCIVPA